MDFGHLHNGTVTVQIITADPTATLARLYHDWISLQNVRILDELTLEFTLNRTDLKKVLEIIKRRDEKYKIVARRGLYWKLKSAFQRPILVFGIGILILMTIFLPMRILFFEIEGNKMVPDKQILELADQCGIHFGAVRRDIRSEKVKNALLRAIPDLEWVGINTAGCVVTISVRERQNVENTDTNTGVSSIIAARDGIVQDITVTAGSAACKTGQAVKAGQLLISGYTDCGLSIRAQRAKGEIYALTEHNLSLVTPNPYMYRGHKTGESRKYSLIIGKKRINFSQDSGNLDASCVKIYEEKYVTLPGGFQLPVAIVIETIHSYDQITPTVSPEESEMILRSYAMQYLRDHMVAGNILRCSETVMQNGVMRLNGHYSCLEMIGREQFEEIITP